MAKKSKGQTGKEIIAHIQQLIDETDDKMIDAKIEYEKGEILLLFDRIRDIGLIGIENELPRVPFHGLADLPRAIEELKKSHLKNRKAKN
jgi:hypothetical protein